MAGLKEVELPYEYVGSLGYFNYLFMQGAAFFNNIDDYVWKKERSGIINIGGVDCCVNDVAINMDFDAANTISSGKLYDDRDASSDAEMVEKHLRPNLMTFLTNRLVLAG